jgi:hypothetical protein
MADDKELADAIRKAAKDFDAAARQAAAVGLTVLAEIKDMHFDHAGASVPSLSVKIRKDL